MQNFDNFVGFLAYELGKVNVSEIFSETKVYERKYGEIYKTEVISSVYNEVGIVFSIEESDEETALDYFEKQQAELYGSIDVDLFKAQLRGLNQQKEQLFTQLKKDLQALEHFKKDIQQFEHTFNYHDLTTSEKQETEKDFEQLNQLKHTINYIERTLQTTVL